jgi:hypothetical protein
MTDNPVQDWFASGRAATITGLEFRLQPHPLMPEGPLYLVGGQATVYRWFKRCTGTTGS